MTESDARLDALEEFAPIHDAIGAVSAVCDYARENDGRGFNAPDAWLGHTLAGMPLKAWTRDAALAAWDMLRKYRGQLAAAGIEYDQLPRPEGADELESERREEARERREEARENAAERREEARQRARERARQWHDEQYRKSRSYVRCDGDGEDVVLSFAYDPELVAACRKIEGRAYDGATKTNRYPFTSLPDVIKFAEDHDIDVTPDVRALAAIAADRAAALAAQPRIRLGDNGTVIIDASLDPDAYQALKEANNDRSTWDPKSRVHRLPLYLAAGLLTLAEGAGLTVSDEARDAIQQHAGQQDRNRAEASTFEAAPVPVPGLAEGLALKPQQYPVVRFALEHRRVLIGDDMGWGKTLSSLAATAADGAYPAVVVCRPSLTLNWSAEIRRFFPGLKIYEASGTTPQPVPPGTDVIVIGSAALAAKPRKTETGGKEFGWVEELVKIGPKALIVDEGQDTKERTANRSQACEQLAVNVIARDGLVLDLTGTAILNRPRELCQQLTMLGRLDEFGGEKKFLWRYCLAETNRWGADYNGARNLIELSDRLRAWGIMIRRSDDAALGLPPCREHVLVVPQADLNPTVMARYREAEGNLLEFLAAAAREAAERLGEDPNSAAVEATMRAAAAEHLVAINTLRQLAGEAKRDYVARWVRSHVDMGEKVMVAAHHRSEVDAYAAEFGGLKLQGGQSVADKEKAKAAFQRKTPAEAPVLSVAIGAGGVGHTLTAARIGIQAEQAWTPGETQQMKKRLHRIGQDRPVDYYITVAEGTIDEQLRAVVTSKQATLDAVLDGRSDTGTDDSETSVIADLTWRLTQQGLGNPASVRPISDEASEGDTPAAAPMGALIDSSAQPQEAPSRDDTGAVRPGAAIVPEALQHWSAGMVDTDLLAEAHRLAAGEPGREELVEVITNSPVRGWLPMPRRARALTVQWDATRVTAPPVPDQSVKVTLVLPEFRFVLGIRRMPGGKFQYRDITDAEALAVLLVPDAVLADEDDGTLQNDHGGAVQEPIAQEADEAPAADVCAVCGTAMTVIEPGQAAHPMCESAPTPVSAVVPGNSAHGEQDGAVGGSTVPVAGSTNPGPGGGVAPPQDEDDDVHAQVGVSAQHIRAFAHRYLNDGLLPVPAWAAKPNGECCCPRGADCDRPGKHPRSVHSGPGARDYSWKPLMCSTPEEIDERFADSSEYAAGNLMVAIPAGMMAVDIDEDDGGRGAAASLAEGLGELPPTLTHKTPHGEHRVYRTPPDWTGRAWVGKDPANPVPAGIDLRMPGQILMAAPSRVPNPDGSLAYGPVTENPVAALPAAYLTAWTPPRPQPRPPAKQAPVPPDSAGRAAKYVHDAMTRIAEDLAARKPGGRNAAAYAAGLKAGSLLGAARATQGAEAAAWTDEEAEQALLDATQRNGYTDKDGEAEALRAIRSGLRNGLRRPRTLPDFTEHRSGPGRQPITGQRGSQARTGPRAAGRWQDLVSADVQREVEAADRAAAARRRTAITAHQQAIEQHDRVAAPGTAAEVERTRAEAHAAHQEYTKDGRHVTGRHDAAMLRWAASITAQREQPAPGPVPDPAGDSRRRADAAAAAANQAYQAGDLDQAREQTDQAAEIDPARADLWQRYRDQITARRAVLAARQAYQETGDRQQAEQLLEQTRPIDPRTRGRAIWEKGLPVPAAAPRQRQAEQDGFTRQRQRQTAGQQPRPQREHATARTWPAAPTRREPGAQPRVARPSQPEHPADAPREPRTSDRADLDDPDARGDLAPWPAVGLECSGAEPEPDSPKTPGSRWAGIPETEAPGTAAEMTPPVPERHGTHDPDAEIEPEVP